MVSTPENMPQKGQRAPAFTLPDQDGEIVALAKLKGANVVLYFYPRDNTPGCTTEAQAFRDALGGIEEQNAVVLGVSPDDAASHRKFCKKFDLNFKLLADTGRLAIEKYGVWVEKKNYGRKYMGVQRATFLIDARGIIAMVWPKVKPEKHAAEVLEALRELNGRA